ncbi:MAG: class I SAM-dependent methyltransferase [Pseudomonadota bacterium]
MAGSAELRKIYTDAAPALRAKWGVIDLDDWLKPVAPHLHGRQILDVGAGTGRLSAHLARHANVTAVEPVSALWEAPGVPRIDDTLPRLARVRGSYDLILSLGVLHHLCPRDQTHAMARMAELTAPGGRLILAARHGPRARRVWPVPAERLTAPGLHRIQLSRRAAIQPGNAAQGVRFTWLVFIKTRLLRGASG